MAVRQVGHGRGRHLAHQQNVDALTGQPRRERGLEHLPRDARVATHDGQWARARTVGHGAGLSGEDNGGRRTEPDRQVDGEGPVGEPTDPIGAEQSRHVV